MRPIAPGPRALHPVVAVPETSLRAEPGGGAMDGIGVSRSGLRFADVPRRGGGSRRLVVLGERDAVTYERVVARVAPRVERRLPAGVLANRSSVDASGLRLHPWEPARRRWHDTVQRLLAAPRPPVVIVTDVSDCYRSIASETTVRGLRAAGCGRDDVAAVAGFLWSLRDRGIRGLPVGPAPSAVLANAALMPLDDALAATGAVSLRWVDDVVVFSATPSDAARVLHVVRATLDALGLAPNEAKTRILSDRAEASAFLVRGGSRTADGGTDRAAGGIAVA
jgi:Reverse transcriptase (RNA-dependent DNA polymerase)